MRTWKGCRVCPFLILENICYSERQFPLGVKQIRSVSPVVTRIYSPTWTRDSPFGLPIPVPGCSRRTWEGGVPAALCGSRIWEPHLGVSNTQPGRYRAVLREGSIRWDRGSVQVFWLGHGELEGLMETWPDSQVPVGHDEEGRGLTSGTGPRKQEDFPEKSIIYYRRNLCGRRLKKLHFICWKSQPAGLCAPVRWSE